MRRLLATCAVCLAGLLQACGGGAVPPRAPSATYALAQSPETLEFEPTAIRAELFRELARQSQLEAARRPRAVLFPVIREGQLVAAPGIDPRSDLFLAPDAGAVIQLDLDLQWSEDRRESLQGLSEREAVELIARALLLQWNLRGVEPVLVERVPGAPYAAAYVDGVLRVNPAFVYLAAAAVAPSAPVGLQ